MSEAAAASNLPTVPEVEIVTDGKEVVPKESKSDVETTLSEDSEGSDSSSEKDCSSDEASDAEGEKSKASPKATKVEDSAEVRESQEEYRRVLDGIEKIRDMAGGELELPQVVVIGNQNQGKSSLLEVATGVPFPEGDGIVTRAAAVVKCRCDPTAVKNSFTVGEKKVPREKVAKEIKKAQTALFKGKKDLKISMEAIQITVSGPDQMDINLVDLPGLIAHGPGQEESKKLVEKYIASENTLILLSSEAKEDDENVAAIGLAKKFDPQGERTIRVLTKFDNFDSPAAKVKAVDLVKAQEEQELGAHAVVCRMRGKKYSANEEMNKLKGVPADRAGVQALKTRLPNIFAKLARKNLPKLKADIIASMAAFDADLDKLGRNETGQREMLKALQQDIQSNWKTLRTNLTVPFNKFKEDVHNSEKGITEDWVAGNMKQDVFSIPFFQGEDEVKECMKEISEEWWKPILDEYLKEEGGSVITFGNNGKAIPGVSQNLLEYFGIRWEENCRKLSKECRAECYKELRKEVDFGTCNHYLTDKFTEQIILPDVLFDKMMAVMDSDDVYSRTTVGAYVFNDDLEQQRRDISEIRELWQEKLKKVRDDWIRDFNKKDLHDQQKHRVYAAVKALFAVEKKTFTDNILKATRDAILKKAMEFVSDTLILEPEFCMLQLLVR